MPESSGSNLPGLLSRYQDRILTDWIAAQSEVGVLRADLMREAELRRQSRSFLNHHHRLCRNTCPLSQAG